MPARLFTLPGDIDVMLDLVERSFQYPENPTWSVQPDEVEGMADTLSGLKRIWPLFRAMQIVYPPLRDAMRGFIWEEDGRPVGLSNVIRMGKTESWTIGNVGVVPEYRRRGIARRLVEDSIDYARQRGASMAVLGVVDGNLPALRLYEDLGFVPYSREAQLKRPADAPPPPECPLPEGYRLVPMTLANWKPRYEIRARLTPLEVQQYEPVKQESYRKPFLLLPLVPVITRAMGMRLNGRAVYAPDGALVATVTYDTRRRPGGTNHTRLFLDPAHEVLAEPLLSLAMREAQCLAPGRAIEQVVESWQPAVRAAAEALGYAVMFEMHMMGLKL